MKGLSMARNVRCIAGVPVVLVTLFSAIVNTDLLRGSGSLNAARSIVGSTQEEVKEVAIENAIGVITLSNKMSRKERRVQIFNDNGSLWYEFSFNQADGDRRFDQAKVDFRPFAFHPDYFVLALKCVGQNASHFKIVVNETTGLTKFIKKNDPAFKFQPWREHILQLFAVGFDPTKNPLRISRSGRAKAVRLPRGVTFHPLQMNGSWLKVRWNISERRNDKGKKLRYGWVKWKENNKLLIELFYIS